MFSSSTEIFCFILTILRMTNSKELITIAYPLVPCFNEISAEIELDKEVSLQIMCFRVTLMR